MAEAAAEDDELAQWIPDCEDCDNPAEHVCKTCGDKLCGACKEQHLNKKRTRHHEVVPYSYGMKTMQKSQSTCIKHPGEKYQAYCTPCRTPVCNPCIIESHGKADHDLVSVAEAYCTAKERATSVLKQMSTRIKPDMMQASDEATKTAKSTEEAVTKLEDEMKNCAKSLHEEVDLVLKRNMESLEEMKEVSVYPRQRHQEQTIANLLSQLEVAIKEYENNLRSDDPIDLIRFMNLRSSENPEDMFPIPAIEEASLPTFSPATISKETLQNQFGCLNLKDPESESEGSADDSKASSQGSNASADDTPR